MVFYHRPARNNVDNFEYNVGIRATGIASKCRMQVGEGNWRNGKTALSAAMYRERQFGEKASSRAAAAARTNNVLRRWKCAGAIGAGDLLQASRGSPVVGMRSTA